MRRLLLLVLAAALLSPSSASAHPLGNFTVNRYSQIELGGNRIYVLYTLDMAEIPTFQERQRIGDEAVYGRRQAARIGRGLRLAVGGRPIPLRPLRHALAFPPGVAGLRTMRLQALFSSGPLGAPNERVRLSYRDTNFSNRIGWREIVVRARDGARVASSSAPTQSISDGLRAYPKDLLKSPLEVDRASATVALGERSGDPPTLLAQDALGERVRTTADGGFAQLIAADELSAGVILLSLLVALFWGAAHAFSPGHGKAIVAGYLVGTRGTPRHAVLLGLIVTISHTTGVFALGLVTLALTDFIVPERLYPWLNLISALLVVGVGLAILRWRFREWRRATAHVRGHDHHGHRDSSHSDHAGDLRGLLGMGISAGILPCPTALVVLLAAISLHRVGYGLVLIVAFSVGLAASITGIGLIAVTAKRLFSRANFDGRAIRLLPAISAAVVLMVGVAMTVRALPAVM